MCAKWLSFVHATAEDGRREQLEGVRPCLQTVAATDASSRVVLRASVIRGRAVARRLNQSGWRWGPPEQ
eukprot:5869598-Alexandrium_andersonii.AAC.1